MKPLIPSWLLIYALLSLMLGTFITLGVLSARNFWRAWRAQRQLEMEPLMRRGFRAAARRGWLPEDTQ